MVTCYPSYDMTPPLPSPAQCSGAPLPGGMAAPMAPMASGKDYSRPLHVDCSVEYELPDAAKPPAGQRSEPLLMIHPCYYRRAEAQRRTRFVNNLPKSLSSPVSSSTPSGRRSKVARLATSSSAVEPAWPQPKPVPVSVPGYPGVPAGVAGAAPVSSCYKVAATADYNAAYRTPLRTPAAPSSAKLDAGTVLSGELALPVQQLQQHMLLQQLQQQQQLPSCSAVPAVPFGVSATATPVPRGVKRRRGVIASEKCRQRESVNQWISVMMMT